MTQDDLFKRLQFICNKAAQEGSSGFEIVGVLELLKHGVCQTVVKAAAPRSPILHAPAGAIPEIKGGQ
jgi:hypothetical protein